ncbi:phospholipid scramblase, putative [Plasmodium ovale wallikeri]|uniref:Phospholipid scramblase n=2 Tax=Plasmodium ovale TaxID=36330 RepID=A0A1A8YMN5_PLAOA|nr:phospholipid scramblase, putative [Plasmodium ovale wallikeri]SBT46207.1 phospholipid scramblase, putative [Plasmodium ovale wallikeri]SBT76060.1 phospholipid scramblase, putative [Plasmodium ovale]
MNNQFMNLPVKKAIYSSNMLKKEENNPAANPSNVSHPPINIHYGNNPNINTKYGDNPHGGNNPYGGNPHGGNNPYGGNPHGGNNPYGGNPHGGNNPNVNYNYPYPNMHNYQHPYPMPPPQQQMQMFVNDWKSTMASLKSCRIKQQFDDREFLADFAMGLKLDFNNRYLVLDASTELLKFTAIESSDFCNRNCLPKMCIPINMKILSYGKQLTKPDVMVEKDCTCTMLCLNRPTIKMYEYSNNNNKRLIGTIKAPFSCCSYKFDLFDSSKNKIIYMDDTCCQLSILFPCPCGPCKFSNYYLRDAKTNEKVAHLQKEVPFLKFVKRDIDNYTLNFEEVKNPEWKMMLLAFSLFLDYIYYDRK